MKFGFIIDNRRCIGCHACSTACKSENEVPLGVNRTWVKYTEVGRYPDVRRHFQVTRCNHCDNPPCVRICPVTAMYQRADGIVEFDPNVCIGCKACIQACPYDAIYIDPDSGTAAKCHYCAHRTDIGLEPACVVVCPEHAIIAGDLEDPESEIAKVLAKETVTVRKPEQGTAPKLFYIDGHAASMHPTAAANSPLNFMQTDQLPGSASSDASAYGNSPSQGLPQAGPLQLGGRLAEQMVQVGFNAQHKIHWHWQVPAYVVTKDIATGVFLLAALFALTSPPLAGASSWTIGLAMLLALIFVVVTTLFLVFDLERPERFFSILLRPQWRSWLARGAFLLVGFSGVLTLLCVLEAGLYWGIFSAGAASLRSPLLLLGTPLALLASIYTAFLFGQAEGRDLWQTPLLPLQFGVRSIVAGASGLLILDAFTPLEPAFTGLLSQWFVVAVAIDLALTVFGEMAMPHQSETAAQAARKLTKGPYRWHLWVGFIGLGRILPILLVAAVGSDGFVAGSILALIGLFAMEYAFVMAPQTIPNS